MKSHTGAFNAKKLVVAVCPWSMDAAKTSKTANRWICAHFMIKR
jgi:hypothetical protein